MSLEYAFLLIGMDISRVLRLNYTGMPAVVGTPEYVDCRPGCDAVVACPSVGFRMRIGEVDASLVIAFVTDVAL